jgi:hypothetical protein
VVISPVHSRSGQQILIMSQIGFLHFQPLPQWRELPSIFFLNWQWNFLETTESDSEVGVEFLVL